MRMEGKGEGTIVREEGTKAEGATMEGEGGVTKVNIEGDGGVKGLMGGFGGGRG